jgi:hypothetical protein
MTSNTTSGNGVVISDMTQHKLERVILTDCMVVRRWCHVLGALLGSTTLQYLFLFQLGQDWHRVEFPGTCPAYPYPLDSKEEWLYVSRQWHEAVVTGHQYCTSSLRAIIQDMRISYAIVNPAAWDAVLWE